MAGWAAVSGALEGITCLTRLNGCDQYGAIRKGGLAELKLEWEPGLWATRLLERRSESTLTSLDARCAQWELMHACGLAVKSRLGGLMGPVDSR